MRVEKARLSESSMETPEIYDSEPHGAIEESIEASYIHDLRDGSKRVTLASGLVVELKNMTGADLSFVGDAKAAGSNEVDISMRIITRLCTKWGDKPGVGMPQLHAASAKDIMRLSEAVAQFLS